MRTHILTYNHSGRHGPLQCTWSVCSPHPTLGLSKPLRHSHIYHMSKLCSICLCDHELEHMKRLGCKHVFCTKCIDTWSKQNNTCPLCRKSFDVAPGMDTTQSYTNKFIDDVDFKFMILATCQHNPENKEILLKVIKGLERVYIDASNRRDSETIQRCTDHFIDIYNYM